MGSRQYFAGDYSKQAYLHIQQSYPYWNRSAGRDQHLGTRVHRDHILRCVSNLSSYTSVSVLVEEIENFLISIVGRVAVVF
jgi:hypothetical protein